MPKIDETILDIMKKKELSETIQHQNHGTLSKPFLIAPKTGSTFFGAVKIFYIGVKFNLFARWEACNFEMGTGVEIHILKPRYPTPFSLSC